MGHRRWVRIGILGLASWLAVAGVGVPARGQPIGEHVDSLEWMAADSSVIVRGSIVGMEIVADPESALWRSVTFQVDETLKGKHRPSIRFVAWSNIVEKDFDRWKEQGRPLLVFSWRTAGA